MAIKELQTRIALKYDSYSAWTDTSVEGKGANLVLLNGELGICEIPSANTASNVAPTVLFKVGNGSKKFSALPWASAKAADVYSWAKASEVKRDGKKLVFVGGAADGSNLEVAFDYVTLAEVQDITNDLASRITALETSVGTNGDIGKSVADHENRLDAIEGTGEGSVAKALTDAKTYTDNREAAIETAYKAYADQAEADAKTYADGLKSEVEADFAAHMNTNNPHGITAATVGLDKVENKTVAEIKTELGTNGTVESNKAGFVTGGTVYTAIEAAKTAANTYADGLNTAMDSRVGDLESFEAAQSTKNTELSSAITAEATTRETADQALRAIIGGNFNKEQTVAKVFNEALAAVEANAATTAQNKVDALANGQVEANRAAIVAMDTAYKAADDALDSRIDTIEGKLANVTNVMDFRGAVSAKPTDGATDYQNGDVVVVTAGDDAGKEFVYDGTKWHEFGYADSNAAAISGLQGRMDTAEGDIDALESRASDLEAADTEIGQRITTLENTVTTGDANTLAEAKTYAESQASAAESAAKSHAETKASEAQTAATNAANAYTDSEVAILEAADAEMSSDITVLKQVTNGYSGDEAIKTAVDAKLASADFTSWKTSHENDHANTKTSITAEISAAVTAEKSARESAVGEVDAKVVALSTRMDTAEGKISTAEGKISTLEGKVKANEDAIAALDTTYVSETEFDRFKISNTAAINGAAQAASGADAKAEAVASRVNDYDTYFGVSNGVFPTTLIFNCGSATEVIEQ